MPHLTATRLPAVVLEDLRRAVGAGRLLTDPLSQHLYKYDGALDQELPAAVALPETTEEVAALVRSCARHGVPFVPRGAGTSLSGGPIPAPGSLLISLTRMNRLLAVSPEDQYAVVQPGMINLDLQKHLEPLGFFYAPDPSSQLVSTIGGNLGHNAGGAHCLKYGVTANHLLAVEVVTPEGEVVRVGGRGGDLPGYDLLALYAGSEGTLGIVTEITVRILPLPEATGTALTIFDSLEAASSAVAEVIARGLVPSALEMIDRPLIEAVERTFHAGYPLDAEAVLLVEVDGPPQALAPQMEAIREVCLAHQVREFHQANDPVERGRLWRGRKGTAAAIANLAAGKISTDVSVPRDALPRMLGLMTDIAQRYGLVIGNILHAGDGNLHPQIIFDPRDAEQMERVLAAQSEIIAAALSLGGTMTGEHGVGTEKRRYMSLMFSPEELALMRRIKAAFDPMGLSNPGKLLPDEIPLSTASAACPEGPFSRAAEAVAVRDEAGRLCPYDYEAMGKLLALATREAQPVVLVGHGRQASAGSAACTKGRGREAEVITALGLHRIMRIEPTNATVTVQAGVRVADLQAALAEVEQWWPILPPGDGQATVGGVLATGRSGPLALRYGRLADGVTGMRLALPTGEVVRFGVTCVKNVSGYALERLLVGSQGTLAAILEIILRTAPLPQVTQATACPARTRTQAQEICTRALTQSVRPAALEVLNSAAAALLDDSVRLSLALPVDETREWGWLVIALWHGLKEEVTAGERALQWAVRDLGVEPVALTDQASESLISALPDLPAGSGNSPVLELTCSPSRCLEVMEAVCEATGVLGLPLLTASPGLGSVRIGLPSRDYETLRPVLDLLSAVAQTRGGVLRRLSPTWGEPLERTSSPLTVLQERLKAAWDPAGILPSLG